MAATPITNRDDFKAYCLRKLGSGVITINVSDEQVEDRIDDAVKYYFEQHYDGQNRVYYKYQVTDADKANQYFPVPSNMLGVSRIFPFEDAGLGRVGDMFDIRYQFALNDLYALTAVDLIPYYMTMTHLTTIDELLVGQTPYRFNKVENRVYLDTDWSYFATGSWIVVEAIMATDPDQFPEMWSDRWLQKYTVALIKKQWAQNLVVATNVALVGGVAMPVAAMMAEAEQDIEEAEEELKDRYTMPALDFMG